MAGNTEEQIESKLAEYVEGTLDEAGRAEIERHLEANPSHRAMLEELMQIRGVLRSLPRASAPRDLMDDLQGQLERTALLGVGDEEPPVIVRINRWPQVMAAAAVIALALGLGALVYMMLPPNRHAAIVMAPQEQGATMRAAPDLDLAGEHLDRAGAAPADRDAAPPVAPNQVDQPVHAAAEPEGGTTLALNKDRWSELLNDPQASGAGPLQAHDGLRMGGPVVLTVLAHDLTQANNQVIQALNAQGVNWSAEGQAPVEVAKADDKQRGYAAAKDEQPALSAQASASRNEGEQKNGEGAGQQFSGLVPSGDETHRYSAKSAAGMARDPSAADAGQALGGGRAKPAPAPARAPDHIQHQVAQADVSAAGKQAEPPRASVYRARVNARQVQEIAEALQRSGQEPGQAHANIVAARLEDQSRKELGRQDRAEQVLAALKEKSSGSA